GTSIVTTRRSTFTIRSTKGRMKKRPGPRAPTKRPRRKITPRSYSWTTLMARKNSGNAQTYASPVSTRESQFGPGTRSGVWSSSSCRCVMPCSFNCLADLQPQAADVGDDHPFARVNDPFFGLGLPVLAVHEHEALGRKRRPGDDGPADDGLHSHLRRHAADA